MVMNLRHFSPIGLIYLLSEERQIPSLGEWGIVT